MLRKTITTLTILLSWCYTIYAQPSIYFSKRIDSGSDKESGLINCIGSDGIYISTDRTNWGDIYSNGCAIIKTDFEGNVLWKRKLYDTFWLDDFHVRNDTLHILTTDYYTQDSTKDLVIQLFNSNGDSLTSIYMGDKNGLDDTFRGRLTEDGGYWGGYVKNGRHWEKFIDTAVYFRADRYGNVLWEGKLGADKYSAARLGIFNFLNDGHYFFAVGGYLKPNNKKTGVTFCELDSEGLKVLERDFPLQPDSIRETGRAVLYLKNTDNYFFVTYMDAVTPKDTAGLNRVATQIYIYNRDLSQRTKSTRFHDIGSIRITGMQELDNGDVICVGNNGNNDTLNFTEGPWIVKFNNKGEMLWNRIIADWRYAKTDSQGDGNSLNYLTGGLSVMPNGDLIITGTIDQRSEIPRNSDIWLLRLDKEGCPYPNCKGRLQEITDKTYSISSYNQLEGIKLMPNPTMNDIWLEFSDEHFGKQYSLQCFDSDGMLQFQQQIDVQRDILHIKNTAALANGFYLLKITDEEGRYNIKKLVKH